MSTTDLLSELATHDRSEVNLDTGLTYDGITPVHLRVTKRVQRWGVTDDGGAISAGASSRDIALPDRIALGKYEVNVSKNGIVCLSAVSPSPEWLDTICELVGRGSIALYEELLDAS